jgi:phosphoribosylanthranilate isomerase
MTKVKICGLMRPEDVEAVNEARPEFAGFVFAKSRRRLMPGNARLLIERLDAGILPVGVFVDEPPEDAADIARYCRLGAVQLHGAEDNGYIERLRRRLRPGVQVIRAFRVKDEETLERASGSACDLLLLDAWSADATGGTGRAFDWRLLMGFECPYLLAGGLNEGNVEEAIERLRPWGVDVSSGVETDGAKDRKKIIRFTELAREL